MKTETNEVRVLKDSENDWIVKELEKITGYKPWFIKEQLGFPLLDVSALSQQELKEATDMLGYDLDDLLVELSLSALRRTVETADEATLWNLYYQTDYNSTVKYVLLNKLLTFSDSFLKSLKLLTIIYRDEIISVESEELLTRTVTLCASQASLEQSVHITSIFRKTQLTKENAAQAQVIAEAQLKYLTCVDDYKNLRALDNFAGSYNWVATRLLLAKLKTLVKKD